MKDGAHLFLRCKQVKKLWRCLELDEIREKLCACTNAKEVIQAVLDLPEDQRVLVTCMLWRWWDCRNKINAGESSDTVERTAVSARLWAAESLQLCSNPKSQSQPKEHRFWQKPLGDLMKINVYGAFNVSTGCGGWGFVARDNSGDIRGSGAGKLQHVASAFQAEATAAWEAIHAASSWGMTAIQVESDCQSLVKALQSTEYDLAPEGVLLKDIRSSARLNFFLRKTSNLFIFNHGSTTNTRNKNYIQIRRPPSDDYKH